MASLDNFNSLTDPSSTLTNNGTSDSEGKSSTYYVWYENWKRTGIYGFYIENKTTRKYMPLPINPSDIAITTNFATNVIPTLYGTVEEHSDVRYYDIQLSGTTGIAPKNIGESKNAEKHLTTTVGSRTSTKQDGLFGTGIGATLSNTGLFSKTVGAFTAAANNAKRAVNQAFNAFSSSDAGAIHHLLDYTGIDNLKTGYLAFHNLYRFLLLYKKEQYSNGLFFYNTKDNIQYQVAIKTFTLKRSASNPMLYDYTIVMRGYDLKNIPNTTYIGFDKKQFKKNMGLDGIYDTTWKGSATLAAKSLLQAVSAAAAGVNMLGR